MQTTLIPRLTFTHILVLVTYPSFMVGPFCFLHQHPSMSTIRCAGNYASLYIILKPRGFPDIKYSFLSLIMFCYYFSFVGGNPVLARLLAPYFSPWIPSEEWEHSLPAFSFSYRCKIIDQKKKKKESVSESLVHDSKFTKGRICQICQKEELILTNYYTHIL